MADKLSESTWTSFTKGLTKKYPKLDPKKLKLEDAELVKALTAYDKTDESKPEPRLKALEELIKQIPEQVKALVNRKKELGDEPFDEAKDKLYALLREAEGLHKSAVAKAAEAKGKGKGKDDDEEEEESTALLTSKMIPLLRELKKGEVAMPFLVALAGTETVVLLSRRPISPARGKLLKEQMAQPTGLKFIRGECRYENTALTFVVQSPGAALAKRLRQALLDQTELRLKVRVRGEDGEEDVEGEDESEGDASAIPNAPPMPGAATDPGAAFTARLTALMPRIKTGMADQRHGLDIKLKASEAGVYARKKDFEAANALLNEVESLLADVERGDDSAQDALAGWQVERTAAIATLKAVAREVAEARHSNSTAAILEINAVMKQLTESPASLRQVAELERYLGEDDVVQDVSELARDIRAPLLRALGRLKTQLPA